jgi:hypothetical protein
MEMGRMEDENVRYIIKEENEGLLNTSKMFVKHSFDLKNKLLPRKRL